MKSPHLITRVDCDSRKTYGWNVRIQRGGGCVDSKFFADRKHGGKRAAMLLAMEWRDANRVPTIRKYGANSRIYLAKARGKYYWQARIPDGDVMRSKSFSVTKYGHDEAKRMASEFLESQTPLPS